MWSVRIAGFERIRLRIQPLRTVFRSQKLSDTRFASGRKRHAQPMCFEDVNTVERELGVLCSERTGRHTPAGAVFTRDVVVVMNPTPESLAVVDLVCARHTQ